MKRLFPFLIFLLCVFSLTAQNNQFNMDSTLFVIIKGVRESAGHPGFFKRLILFLEWLKNWEINVRRRPPCVIRPVIFISVEWIWTAFATIRKR